jgi:Uncharacterised protein family (UPF0182)
MPKHNQVPFGVDDPLYNKDIGFYLFSLPAAVRDRPFFRPTSAVRNGSNEPFP